MTSANTFPQRLTKIDGLMRDYHPHLTADDQCYFIGEYTADMGYSYSRTNSLISNLKRTWTARGSLNGLTSAVLSNNRRRRSP